MPIQVVCSSFNQIVSLILRCMNCVHILDINPGPVISFANILSYSFLRLPFCFVSGFLCCVKAFKLNWVPVVYVCLCFLCLRRQIQKIMPLLYWRVSCLCFLLVLRFLVLRLGFLIDFEFIFGGSVRKCFHFILLHVAILFSQHHLLKRLSLPCCIFLPHLSEIDHNVWVYFWALFSVCFCVSPMLFWLL